MTEPLTRVTLEAELPDHLAKVVEDAKRTGQADSLSEAVRDALLQWSAQRQGGLDPDSWAAHASAVRAAIAEADADPDGDIDAAEFFRQLHAELAADELATQAAE